MKTARLYGVLKRRLQQVRSIAGADYSVAVIAIDPWIVLQKRERAIARLLSYGPAMVRSHRAAACDRAGLRAGG